MSLQNSLPHSQDAGHPAPATTSVAHSNEESAATTLHSSPSPSPPSLRQWSSTSMPMASIGVLSDIQMNPILENGHNFHRTETRYYRHALNSAARAMEDLVAASTVECPISHVIHFGDLIDGNNRRTHSSQQAFEQVMAALPAPATVRTEEEREAFLKRTSSTSAAVGAESSSAQSTVDSATVSAATSPFPSLTMYHLIGNHEIYNFTREFWADRLALGDLSRRSIHAINSRRPIAQVKLQLDAEIMFPTDADRVHEHLEDLDAPFTMNSPIYYDFTLTPRYRFIMLDSFEVAFFGRDPEHPCIKQAKAIVKKINLNEDDHTPHGETYVTRRFVPYNGGISEMQLKWLVRVLEDAEEQGQYAILCSHVPFHPSATKQHLQVWNQHEIMQIIEQHPCVVACLHGHDHDGGSHVDELGVNHHVFEAVLTVADGRSRHGRLDLFEDRIELRGADLMNSRTMYISKRAVEFYENKQKQSSQTAHSKATTTQPVIEEAKA